MPVKLHPHRSAHIGKARRSFGLLVILAACFAVHPAGALAVTCPNANPVVNENNCTGAGSSGWRLSQLQTRTSAGFATQTSFNLGESVPLKIARNAPACRRRRSTSPSTAWATTAATAGA